MKAIFDSINSNIYDFINEPSPALRAPSPNPLRLRLRRTGEGDNLKQLCLLPFEEWEKGELANDRPDEGPLILVSLHQLRMNQIAQRAVGDRAEGVAG